MHRADLGQPSLLAVLERPEFVPTALPLLAIGQVRHVGEPVAVVLAEDPYLAEDAAELVGRRSRRGRPPPAWTPPAPRRAAGS